MVGVSIPPDSETSADGRTTAGRPGPSGDAQTDAPTVVPPPGAAQPAGAPGSVRFGALRRSAARAWPAITLYLVARLISTLLYAVLAMGHGYARRGLFVFVDSGWYQLIAQHGYNTHIATFGAPFPFFPLFPGLMALGHAVTGINVNVVGVIVAWAASIGCAWALFEIGRLVRDARVGLFMAVLWALMPSAVIEGASYADPLAICLTAWAMYALLRKHWLAAGICALFAGLTRPTAEAVAAVVCIAALIELWQLRKTTRPAGLAAAARTGAFWRPVAAFVLAPLGTISFLIYVAIRMGSLTGYLKAQQDWGTGFTNIGAEVHRVREAMVGSAPGYHAYPALITTAVLLAVPVLIAMLIIQRVPWPLWLYSVLVAAVVYTTIHDYTVIPREFLALFPVLLVPATALTRAERRSSPWLLLGLMAAAAGWYACFIPVFVGGSMP